MAQNNDSKDERFYHDSGCVKSEDVHQVFPSRPPSSGLEPQSAMTANVHCGYCGFDTTVLTVEIIDDEEWKCPRCRDQFAAAALTGFCSHREVNPWDESEDVKMAGDV
jgi:hypothetical protein